MKNLCRYCGEEREPAWKPHRCPPPPCGAEEHIEGLLDTIRHLERGDGLPDSRVEGWAMWDWAIENAEEIWKAACELEPSLTAARPDPAEPGNPVTDLEGAE